MNNLSAPEVLEITDPSYRKTHRKEGRGSVKLVCLHRLPIVIFRESLRHASATTTTPPTSPCHCDA